MTQRNFSFLSDHRQADVRGSSSIHPSSVRGQEQKHDKRDLLPSNLCNRYQQYPVRVRRCHRCDHCQQPARLWAVLTAAACAHPVLSSCPSPRSLLTCLYSNVSCRNNSNNNNKVTTTHNHHNHQVSWGPRSPRRRRVAIHLELWMQKVITLLCGFGVFTPQWWRIRVAWLVPAASLMSSLTLVASFLFACPRFYALSSLFSPLGGGDALFLIMC